MRRVTDWLWTGQDTGARLARLSLAPAAWSYQAVSAVRTSAYRAGLLSSTSLCLPSVCIGNLSVGGTGKTPLASWAARFLASGGVKPAILLRGYGDDEGVLHRDAVPEAVVIEDADRVRGALTARRAGAQVAVLDDGYQRLDVRRDVDIALVSAESVSASRLRLPAGPWREGWRSLDRATLVVVTRKRATLEEAEQVARHILPAHSSASIAELYLAGFHGLRSGRRVLPPALAGSRILVAAGIGDPASLGEQVAALGAEVEVLAFPDHHPYRASDVADVLSRAGRHARVVITAKDAVKLGPLWPAETPEPWVAGLAVRWDRGREEVESALTNLTLSIRGGESRCHP